MRLVPHEPVAKPTCTEMSSLSPSIAAPPATKSALSPAWELSGTPTLVTVRSLLATPATSARLIVPLDITQVLSGDCCVVGLELILDKLLAVAACSVVSSVVDFRAATKSTE